MASLPQSPHSVIRVLRAIPPLLILLLSVSCNSSEAAKGQPDPSASGEAKSQSGDAQNDEQEDGPHLVRVAALEPQAVEERLPCTSHIESFHTVEVAAQARGQVLEVRVKEGQVVEKDDVLFRLDDREAVLNLESAKNRLKTAADQRMDAELAIDEANDRIAKARIEFRQAERSLVRRKESAAENLASESQLEDAQLAHDQAKNAIALAENTLAVAQHGLAKADTELESAKIQVRIQQRLLEDYSIRAPIDGIIPELMVRGGEWLAQMNPVCTIVAHDQLVLNLKRPQKELGRLRVGQRVEVHIDAWPEEKFGGEIDFISPVVDPETGTFLARVRLALDARGRLRPGMFCRAWIITGTSHEALMIPKEAIVYEAQQPFAFVVRDGKAQRITIDRGIDLRDAVEARNVAATAAPGSFTRGDKIVVVGVDGLADGNVKVQVVKS